MGEDNAEAPVSYEDLAAIEEEFDAIDLEITRKQYTLSLPTYARRAALTARIPSFWPLVFEQCPPELDAYILPQDSAVLAKHLTGFSVNRPELDADPVGGDPRTVRFRFEFAGEDRPFEDEVLEKTVWMGKDGMGSEPVQVRWKEGKDLSGGVTAATQRWWEAGGKADGPEWKDLIQKVEEGVGW